MPKFRYKGETHLENLLGFDWDHGSVHEVTDAYAIRKLTNNPTLFEAVSEGPPVVAALPTIDPVLGPAPTVTPPQMPKRRGRPAKEAE